MQKINHFLACNTKHFVEIQDSQGLRHWEYLCPYCNLSTVYTKKSNLVDRIEKGRCAKCFTDLDPAFKEVSAVKDDKGLWHVPCPTCFKDRTYTTQPSARRTIRAGILCRKCGQQKRRALKIELTTPFDKHLRKAKQRSEYSKKQYSFNLTTQDVEKIWEGECFYTHVDLVLENPVPQGYYLASLDRIDSDIGYEPDNVVWTCKEVNIMKGNLTLESFVNWCSLVCKNK